MPGRRSILLVPLVALFVAFVATTEDKRAEAEDVAPPVQGENVDVKVTTAAAWSCTGEQIYPFDKNGRHVDIDAIINNDPASKPTRFCVHAGTYQVSEVARLKTGDTLDAEPGRLDYVDPTTNPPRGAMPTPKVELVGSGTDTLLSALGDRISITWVDVSGASGTGRGAGAIAAGSAGSDFLVQYARIHNNDALGISNMLGRVLDSEFFKNSEAPGSIGVNASAVKGITQFEAGGLYVHEEQGNGIWCDVGCDKDSARTKGFWVHDSVVINSGRAGIRYENSATQALIEWNEIHGNGAKERRGGVDIRDAQHAVVSNNIFGNNGDQIGVRATGSGRSGRVKLADVRVERNNMNKDRIVSCGGPVSCSGNTAVSTRSAGSLLTFFEKFVAF